MRPHTNPDENHVKILVRLKLNLNYKIFISLNLRIGCLYFLLGFERTETIM